MRTRLVRAIDDPQLCPVTLIVAGAGYGKTLLAQTWARQAGMRIGWLDLDVADNDPWVFTRRLVDRLHSLDPSAPDERSGAKARSAYRDPAGLALDVASVPGRFCLVLDNAEAITNAHVHELMDTIIGSLPDGGALMLISRSPLPLRLARLRARGDVRDIDAEQMRFTLEEASELLATHFGAEVADEDVWRVWHGARGWPVAVFFAAMAMRAATTDGPRIGDWEARWHRYVDAYVDEEVLSALPMDTRQFLLRTAELPYLSKPLCGAALEVPAEGVDLDASTRGFTFLEPVGVDDERLMVHPAVAASLRRLATSRLSGEERHAGLARAVAYLQETGDIRTAARLVSGVRDAPWLAELAEALCRRLVERSDFDRLLEVLDQLPDGLRTANPMFAYWHILARLGLRHHYGIDEELDRVATVWTAGKDAPGGGRLALCRGLAAYCGNELDRAESQLQEALEGLPQDAAVELLHAHTMLGQIDLDGGADAAAARHLETAGRYAAELPLDEQWAWRAIGAERGNTYAFRGDLHSAITKYQLLIEELPPALAHLEGFLRCRLVTLWIERDDLQRAMAELRLADRLRSEHRGTWHHDLVLVRARLLLAMGDANGAHQWASSYVKRVRRLPEKNQLVLLLARIWLSRGELSLVRHWLADIESLEYSTVHVFGDISKDLIGIEADLAQGRFGEAKTSAAGLVERAAATLRWSTFIEASMRLAVALHALGELEASHAAVRAALGRGVSGGFARSYLVPGFDTLAIFADVWHETEAATALRRQLMRGEARPGAHGSDLLTSRELEILRRVARGESNRAIADSLYISTNTVRNHLVKAFRRLDARSRVEAVARARELGLLD